MKLRTQNHDFGSYSRNIFFFLNLVMLLHKSEVKQYVEYCAGLFLSPVLKQWKMHIARWKKHQSHFTVDMTEKGEPLGHLPRDGPRLVRMSAQRSGWGPEPVTVIRTWTQKVLEPQVPGGWQIIWEKNLYNFFLFIYTEQSVSAIIKDRDSPGQTSLHCILIMRKDGEGMEVESMIQSLDFE